jgi:transposase
LDVAACRDGTALEAAQFANTAAGHSQLVRWLTKRGRTAQVVLEATGVYSLDVALALHAAARVEVMVLNPRGARDFARATLQRSSTDATMAATLQAYAQRMPFVAWVPPAPAVRELRALARRLTALTAERVREKNRLHAAQATTDTPAVVVRDVEENLAHLERRSATLTAQACALITAHPELQRAYTHLTSVKGVATASAIQVLPELLVLPANMTVRQWVAHAGLDPRHWQSGTSVHLPTRISKVGNVHLRRALYMPALVAVRYEPQIKAFYEHLRAKGKAPLQALVAVMRKLLHAFYGMLRTDTDFDGRKFFAPA